MRQAPPIGPALAERLRGKGDEIEEAVLSRVFSVTDATASTDPAYLDGLRGAVASALDYAIRGIEDRDAEPGPIPTELLAQARYAARSGVSLATVLRRYFAGHTLLADFLMSEAEGDDLLTSEEFQRLSRTQAELFDRIIDAIANEYRVESEARSRSRHQRRSECVQKLLAGELADTSELGYDIHAWHLGLVAHGAGLEEAVRVFVSSFDRRVLSIPQGEDTLWVWLGGVREIDSKEVGRLQETALPTHVTVAVGEPGRGVAGWRLTHKQAVAALPVGLRSTEQVVRYADVSMLASMLQDEVLRLSLTELYLAPLEEERDGGEAVRQTLRAYFDSDRNVSSAAAALKVTRHTVANRLRIVEAHIGRPLGACATELEAALRLDQLARPALQ